MSRQLRFSQRIPYLIVLAAVLCGPVTAQSPRVYRDRIDPHWFADNSRFWYRNQLPEGKSEFVLVDTTTGTRQPAFDHAQVAEAMGQSTGSPVDPARLPVNSLEFADDLSSVLMTGRMGSWQMDLKSGSIQRTKQESSVSAQAFFLPPRKSVDRGGDTELEIHNQLAESVKLIWMDRSGEPQGYGSIPAGGTKTQHTFVGHVWLLQSADGKPLAAFEAVDGPNLIRVSVETLAGVRQPSPAKRPGSKRQSQNRDDARPVSPDGRWSAWVNDHNLWLRSSSDDNEAEPVQLSDDGTLEDSFHKDVSRRRMVEMRYNLQDPSAETPDVRWSPDGAHLLAFQTRRAPERRVYYVESSPRSQLQPRLESYPYAKPGDPLPVPQPRLFSIADGKEISVSTSNFPNPFRLQFLRWSDDGSRFWMLYNERGHQSLKVLEVTAASGAVRVVVDEHSDTFIHYSSDGKYLLKWLPENELLWASERSGWNHLYRYRVSNGQVINAVTSGAWNVRRIERIDEESRVIWFYAIGIAKDQDPYHEHFCRVDFDGSNMRILSQGDGTHEVTFSPDRSFFLDRYSRVDLPPVTELRRSDDGTLVTKLETADASEVIAARGRLPTRFTAKGRDGQTDIWGIIHVPLNFDPHKKYPVVEQIYAGPHDFHVPKSFRTGYRNQHQIADRGMIVVQIDGMGTAWRSKAFHDVCFQNLKDAGFPDRIAWMKAAAEQFSWMDISRVGIYGGSAGGQNAMAALLWHGTFYDAAVADCGCHDNRMDKLWWNEQWMGWPVGQQYVDSSNVENAYRLQGRLMVVVGELDRNVDPASTTQVLYQLIKADKDFDFLLVPGAGHGAGDRPWAARRRADFLARHLALE